MLGIVLTLALAATPTTALPKDVFARDRAIGATPGLPRLTTDLLLGRAGAERRLEARLAKPADNPGDAQLEGYQQLCGFYFRKQQFAEGLRTCIAAETIKQGSTGNMIDLHRAYAAAGPVSWSSNSVRIALTNGQRTTARRGATLVDTLIDTGTEIGIVSQGAATALQARPLGNPLQVGTTTTPIDGKLVQIDRVEVGNAELRRLTALVIPDEQAAMMGAQLVIPLPALIGLGRLAYLDHGKALALGADAPALGSNRAPLYWDESGVGFAVRLAGGVRGAHFDSGAETTWFFPAAAPILSAAERATRRSYQRKIAGLGGARTEQASVYRNVTLTVGTSRWHFPQIEMAEKDENGESARIGIQLFDRFRTVVLDFRRMQMSAGD